MCRYTLVTVLVAVATLFIQAPGAQGEKSPGQPPSPSVLVLKDGFRIAPAPGKSPGQTVANARIPNKDGQHDFSGLRAAMTALRASYPRLPALTLRARQSTRWEVVVKTLAHLRQDKEGKALFPVVFLAL